MLCLYGDTGMEIRRLKGIEETKNGLGEDKKQREGSWDRMIGVLFKSAGQWQGGLETEGSSLTYML